MSKRKVIPGPHDGEDKPHPVVHRRSSLVSAARLKKVESAFSTCSESFCGITSTLSGRELVKFIATPQYGKEELYDLARDRGEVHKLVAERPALAGLLLRLLLD